MIGQSLSKQRGRERARESWAETAENRKGKFFLRICFTSSSSADFNSSAENGAALKHRAAASHLIS